MDGGGKGWKKDGCHPQEVNEYRRKGLDLF